MDESLIRVNDKEAKKAWEEFCKKHIQPARLFRLAKFDDCTPTPWEMRHLLCCMCCSQAWKIYLEVD